MKAPFITIFFGAYILTGCNWDPPRDNPLDPGNYRYQPAGTLEIVAVDHDSGVPLSGAEIRLPRLNTVKEADSLGRVRFESVLAGRWSVKAERRGDRPFASDSITVNIVDAETTRDTLRLRPLPTPDGSLLLRVLTLAQQPIANATVLVPDLGRFAVTDEEGTVSFSGLTTGNWWVFAQRDEGFGALYGRDSIFVSISASRETVASIRLDGLPEVLTATANSVTSSEVPGPTENIRYLIHLQATVLDPDTPADLKHVEATLYDSTAQETIHILLQFNPSPPYWWADIPSESFASGSIDAAWLTPFAFRAFDYANNGSPPKITYMARVIHDVPILAGVQAERFPKLVWNFPLYNELPETTLFNYRVRVYHFEAGRQVDNYVRILAPENSAYNEHRLEVYIGARPPEYYRWDVTVIDRFGNSARSGPGPLEVTP